jgi:hypothetical protein
MRSRIILCALGMATWAAVALTAAPSAPNRHHGRNVSIDDDGPIQDCSALHVTFDGDKAAVQSEDKTITKSEAGKLRIRAEENGGMQVRGWDQETYSVSVCKAAAPGAQDLLAQIHLNYTNGELSVSGPSNHEDWVAYVLVRAPKGADLDLHVMNGPMSILGVDGNVTAHAMNGPVTLKGSSGDIRLEAENGPITVRENSGRLNLRTQNGPVDVDLSGESWSGAGMEAHATNGPVTIRVPHGYKSGVVVESDGNGPFSCHASVCSEGRKTWDDDHKRVEFGAGPAVIRVSTVNGPVSVQ